MGVRKAAHALSAILIQSNRASAPSRSAGATSESAIRLRPLLGAFAFLLFPGALLCSPQVFTRASGSSPDHRRASVRQARCAVEPLHVIRRIGAHDALRGQQIFAAEVNVAVWVLRVECRASPRDVSVIQLLAHCVIDRLRILPASQK